MSLRKASRERRGFRGALLPPGMTSTVKAQPGIGERGQRGFHSACQSCSFPAEQGVVKIVVSLQ